MIPSGRLRAAMLPFEPCLPTAAPSPPAGPDWLHEIKHDGYRIIARRDGDRVRLVSRRGLDWGDRFPAIVVAGEAFAGRADCWVKVKKPGRACGAAGGLVAMTPADDERRRALALLAENPDGRSRAIMLARGFPLALLNRLVRAGLATSHIEREERGDKIIEIARVKITDAGRRSL